MDGRIFFGKFCESLAANAARSAAISGHYDHFRDRSTARRHHRPECIALSTDRDPIAGILDVATHVCVAVGAPDRRTNQIPAIRGVGVRLGRFGGVEQFI